MAIDPYSLCPGGLGKKVKFCCNDLVAELDKIDRLREADQRAACLDHIEKLDAKHPGRACLMTAKADLLRDMGRTEEADQALKPLLEQNVANPVALAEAALLACEQGDGSRAMSMLQQALAARQDPMPEQVVIAMRETGLAMLESQEFVAGRQLLTVYSALVPQDREIQAALGELARSKIIPLLLKDYWPPEKAPETAPWKADYEAALEPSRYAAWSQCEQKLTALAARNPRVPQIWRTLAIFRSWLADHGGATEAWRKLASLDVPSDDAVEAEGIAQLLDPDAPDFVEMVQIEYQIHDLERLEEVLASCRRCSALPVDAAPPLEGVPPKSIYLILDREKQADDAPLAFDTTPQIIGRTLIFGRETDREPRLELSAYRGKHLAECQELLGELTFGMLGPAKEGDVLERVAAPLVDLELRWFLQKQPNVDDLYEQRKKHREEYLRQQWPKQSQELLAGKSPEQAASQPSLRIPLLAGLLRLQTQLEQAAAEFDFDELRRRLQLPTQEAISAEGTDVEKLSVVRLARLDFPKLEDQQLGVVAMRATMDGLVLAAGRAMEENLRRPKEKRPLKAAVCYQFLSNSVEDSRRKLEYLDQAAQALKEEGLSCAPVDVQRLHIYIYRQDQEHALPLIVHLIDEHLNDQQFGQLVIETLAGLGLVRPDGRILRPRIESSPIAAAAGVPEPGKIWTPDSERAGSGEKKSALWVPGS